MAYQPTNSDYSSDEDIQTSYSLRTRTSEIFTRSATPLSPQLSPTGYVTYTPSQTPLGYRPEDYVQQDRTITPLGYRPEDYVQQDRTITPLGDTSQDVESTDTLSPTFTQRMATFDLPKVEKKTRYKIGHTKRKFHGNPSTKKKAQIDQASRSEIPSPIPANIEYLEAPTSSRIANIKTVAAHKLVPLFNPHESESITSRSDDSSNLIMNFKVLKAMFQEMTLCKFCLRGNIQILQSDHEKGIASYFNLKCDNCGQQKSLERRLQISRKDSSWKSTNYKKKSASILECFGWKARRNWKPEAITLSFSSWFTSTVRWQHICCSRKRSHYCCKLCCECINEKCSRRTSRNTQMWR